MAEEDGFSTVRTVKGRSTTKEAGEKKRVHKIRRKALRDQFFREQVPQIRDDYVKEHVDRHFLKHPRGPDETEAGYNKRVDSEREYWLGEWRKMCGWDCNDAWMEKKFEEFVLETDSTAATGAWKEIDLETAPEMAEMKKQQEEEKAERKEKEAAEQEEKKEKKSKKKKHRKEKEAEEEEQEEEKEEKPKIKQDKRGKKKKETKKAPIATRNPFEILDD